MLINILYINENVSTYSMADIWPIIRSGLLEAIH